jgi:hypothetical protein
MPGIIPQLGPKSMDFLKEFLNTAKNDNNGDDDVPDLVGNQNFEDIAE